MNTYTEFKTKAEATKAVTSRGYVHTDTGQSGDGAYGSREYFEKPNCARNQFGAAMDIAVISKVGGRWLASINYKPI